MEECWAAMKVATEIKTTALPELVGSKTVSALVLRRVLLLQGRLLPNEDPP